jgi:hypothetical protein
MRKILGTRDEYYVQTNNAQVYLFQDYFKVTRAIACGPTAAVMCADIAGWPMDLFTPGEQPEDSLLMVLHNPKHLPVYQEARDLDYNVYPPNEIPQCYPPALKIIYGKDVCRFSYGLTPQIVKDNIDLGICMMISGTFPSGGHYVSLVGYDDVKQTFIFNDPYPNQWEDKNGYNREMTLSWFGQNIQHWRVDFLRA